MKTTQWIAFTLTWIIGALLITQLSLWHILLHALATFVLCRWPFALRDMDAIHDTPIETFKAFGLPMLIYMLLIFDGLSLAGGLLTVAGATPDALDHVPGIAIMLALLVGVLLAVGPYAVMEKSHGRHHTRY